jgi:hypothetical protein
MRRVGLSTRKRFGVRRAFSAAALALALAAPARGQTRALIVTGLGAEEKYHQQFMSLGSQLSAALVSKYGIPEANVVWLGEDSTNTSKLYRGRSTAQNISREVDRMAGSAKPNEQTLVVLIGHGSGEGEDTKFNIPGPDLTAREFSAMANKFNGGRLAFLDLTTASGDALPILSLPNRIVITSTKSAYERNESQFARFFVEALTKEGAADVDKDGRVSLLEAYRYAATETKRTYQNDERMVTEHSQLDDDGNGKGSDLPDGRTAGDGMLSRRFFLDAVAGQGKATSADPRLQKLYDDRFALEDKVDALRQKKASLKEDAYYEQLEVLLFDLAKVNRDIRQMEGRK